MALTPLQTLKKARALISDPKRFCTGTFAADKHGGPVSCMSPRAFMFCSEGACIRALGTNRLPTRALESLEAAATKMVTERDGISGKTAVWSLNDDLGHAAVLQMFDLAIHSLQRKASKRKTAKKGKAKAKRGKR